MGAKKKAAGSFTWSREVTTSEGAPVVVADVATFTKRAGNVEGASEYVDIDDGPSSSIPKAAVARTSALRTTKSSSFLRRATSTTSRRSSRS